MSGGVRVAVYAVLGIILAVAFDPRTWGGDVDGHGDEVGILLGAQWAGSLLTAMLVLAVIVVTAEVVVRARRERNDVAGSESEGRSWYE